MLYSSSANQQSFVSNYTGLNKIRVVIADDHPVVREGLMALLNSFPDIEIIGEAGNGRQLVQMVKNHQPDVVLTDLIMPEADGIEAIREIKAYNEAARCIILSQYDSEQLILDAIKAGALGFVVKTAHKQVIHDAISNVYSYRPYYCHFSATRLNHLALDYLQKESGQGVQLSDQEKKVIRLICDEKSSSEIGKDLFLSSRTVEGHKARIMNKTGAKTSIGIVIYAIMHGIYPLPGKR